MGADDTAAVFDDEDDNAGYKTGASTPGYRREDGRFFIPLRISLSLYHPL